MVWGGIWTPEKVGARLVDAFRVLPGTAIYSPTRYELRPVEGQPVAPVELIVLARLVLVCRPEQCIALLTWARISAIEGDPDASIGQHCLWSGQSRSTFEYRVRRAKERVAAALTSAMAPTEL